MGQIQENLIPAKIRKKIDDMKQMLSVNSMTLKRITDHFIRQLERGLAEHGSEIPMNVTWAMHLPTGHETGRYIIIDMGCTDLRICDVELTAPNGGYEFTQSSYRLPKDLFIGTGEQLWHFIADQLYEFLNEHGLIKHDKQGPRSELGDNQKLPLAFTFSYPVTQAHIRHGVLQRRTKGLDISGAEGHDVVGQLENALQEKNIPVRVVALVNDSTGVLMASAYRNPNTKIGSIFSTGCNAAYMERCGAIPKIAEYNLPPDSTVAINCEYGAFDNRHEVLPRVSVDLEIDQESAHPGQQTYEKMIAGMYLGEVLRVLLVHLHESVGLFAGWDIGRLRQRNTMDSESLSKMDADGDEEQRIDEARNILMKTYGIAARPHELRVCCLLGEIVCMRAARLYACGIAALFRKQGLQRCVVGVDGATFGKHSRFQERAVSALQEILEWPDGKDLVQLCTVEDGSGVGAAVIAALSSP
ncbi:hexokinase-domain-containing protein [Aspergillus varians]